MHGVALEPPPVPVPVPVPAAAPVGGDAGPAARGPALGRRRLLVDAACVVVAIVGGALLLAERVAGEAGPGLLLSATADLLLGLAASAALAWRRRRPVHLAVALGLLSALVTSAGIAGAVALFTVAVHRPLRVVVPVAALHAAIVAPYVLLHPDPTVPALVEAVLAAVITACVVAWGMYIRARRQLVLSLRERAERAEAEQQLRVEQARDHERARIAREMHDVLAHRLSLVSLHAGALEFRAQGAAPAPHEVARAAAVIRSGAHDALDDLRSVIGMLRDEDAAPAARPQPALGDLPALVAESRAAGVRVGAEVAVDAAAVPPATGRAAYRIVQEGLTNARKHAPGVVVAVTLTGGPGDGLAVTVANGRPVSGAERAAAIPGTGAGLVGLAERVALAGGTLRHGPTPEGGFALEARLPWPA